MRDDKLWARFPLTRAAIEQCDPGATDGEPADSDGNPLLRELMHAAGAQRIAPGMYYVSKLGRTPHDS